MGWMDGRMVWSFSTLMLNHRMIIIMILYTSLYPQKHLSKKPKHSRTPISERSPPLLSSPLFYQSPHPSSFPPPFLIAAVPIAPFFSAPASPNESQKSLLSGSTATPLAAPPDAPVPVSSTKLLKRSAAPLVPDWIDLAAWAAVRRAVVARSASAI